MLLQRAPRAHFAGALDLSAARFQHHARNGTTDGPQLQSRVQHAVLRNQSLHGVEVPPDGAEPPDNPDPLQRIRHRPTSQTSINANAPAASINNTASNRSSVGMS